MKIAIDCRYLGKSGIGRVCDGIIENLDYTENNYYLIGNSQKLKKFAGATVIEDDTEPYSVKGLLKFNKKRINKECDCIIIPNFLIPYGIKIPVYSIMHDLIFLDIKETTNGFVDYLEKKFLLKRAMKKSRSISCVSAFTKSRCEHFFPKYADKCHVNYNGISKEILEYKRSHSNAEKTNHIVFVGNVKRHKGLKTLLSAFSKIKDDSLKLKIIGEKEGFITGLELDENAYKNVVFTGRLDDEALYREIASAKYLVLPSVYEGFGLPPLEALCLNTQPIVSDIPVFREIYADFPVKFFKTEDELTALLQSEPDIIEDCEDKILEKYNFKDTAKKLLEKCK